MHIQNYKSVLTIIAAIMFGTAPAHAVDLEENVATEASPSEAWALIEDFCSISQWHPVIAECVQEDKGGETHRTLTTADGAELLEKLNSIDSDGMAFTYSILESPLPIANYESTMSISEDANGGSTITWVSSFDAAGVSEEDAMELMQGIYRAGLDELKVKLDK